MMRLERCCRAFTSYASAAPTKDMEEISWLNRLLNESHCDDSIQRATWVAA